MTSRIIAIGNQTARQADRNRRIRRRISFNRAKVSTIGLLLVVLSSTADETGAPDPVKESATEVQIDSFEGPRLLAPFVRPVYPQSRLIAGEESWVELNFMVDSDGKPYEIVVTDSIGDS
ncbi:MAG: hypothetical protein OXG24_04435, partial [Gammaproteobacteria bacterium]|nr:hypothetical protein [Gammaproteobacteria bacterium]